MPYCQQDSAHEFNNYVFLHIIGTLDEVLKEEKRVIDSDSDEESDQDLAIGENLTGDPKDLAAREELIGDPNKTGDPKQTGDPKETGDPKDLADKIYLTDDKDLANADSEKVSNTLLLYLCDNILVSLHMVCIKQSQNYKYFYNCLSFGKLSY